jgi:uncharacterized protein YpmB
MKKIIIIFFWLLIWFMPFSPAGAEPYSAFRIQAVLEYLSEGELNNTELSEIAGQGSKVSIDEGAERGNAKIIFWDEAQNGVIKVNFSTGYGNSQRNTLSIQGR